MAEPMGARRRITFFDEPINGGDWSPTGARKGIVYLRDVGGDENYQLEYLDPAAATPVRLTDWRGRASLGVWSSDGPQYAFRWTVRTGVQTDIYVDDPLDRMPPRMAYEAAELFYTVSYGKGLMLGYAATLPIQDHWAAIAYLRALQLSRLGSLDEVPEALRGTLKK